ncbi:MAG TPA: ATP-binding protein [Acidimicrobiales bacterium]|nr:ATP-binding protein [Acidimicrobiales bacterium]
MTLFVSVPAVPQSVATIRHMVGAVLTECGVADATAAEITLALDEACANVVLHAGPVGEYEVLMVLDKDCCELGIYDRGRGFDRLAPGFGPVGDDSDGGRGFSIMRATMDHVELSSAVEDGTVVILRKSVALSADSVLHHCDGDGDGTAADVLRLPLTP